MRYIVVFIIVLAIALCCSCGGGTSTSTTTTHQEQVNASIPDKAQGVYAGTYSWNQQSYVIVLPDDMFYAIEGIVEADGSMTRVTRLVTGQGKSKTGIYTADLTAMFVGDPPLGLTLYATYVPGKSLTGTVAPPSSSTLTATVLPVSQFDFNVPASLSRITGTWTGIFLHFYFDSPESGTVAISTNGDITSVGEGCSYSGKITPDANKNFFNVTITLGAAPCNTPNQTISGAAVEMLLPNGVTRQLLIVMRQSTFGVAALR